MNKRQRKKVARRGVKRRVWWRATTVKYYMCSWRSGEKGGVISSPYLARLLRTAAQANYSWRSLIEREQEE